MTKKRRRVCSRPCVPPLAAPAPASRLHTLLELRAGLPAGHRRPSSHAALLEAPCAAGQLRGARAARLTRAAGWGAWSAGRAALGPDVGSGNARRQAAAGRVGPQHRCHSGSGWEPIAGGGLLATCANGARWRRSLPPPLLASCIAAILSRPAPSGAHAVAARLKGSYAALLQRHWRHSSSRDVAISTAGVLTAARQPLSLPFASLAAARRALVHCRAAHQPCCCCHHCCLQERRPQQARPRPRQARALRVVRRHGAHLLSSADMRSAQQSIVYAIGATAWRSGTAPRLPPAVAGFAGPVLRLRMRQAAADQLPA